MIEPEVIKTKGISLKGIIYFVVGVVIVFFILAWTSSCKKGVEAPKPPKKVLGEVRTETFTLLPGKSIVFSTVDEKTGLLCNYIPIWDTWTEKSELRHTTHKRFGQDGVGSLDLAGYLFPKDRSTFIKGDSDPINDTIHYVMVENIGPDTVTFTVRFIGWRLPPIKPL
ncbi:MAG: hypothetical protein WC087_00435 [Candidatus Paceibacterota bacterium]